MAIPGDKVLHRALEYVVVDVTDDGYAVLRKPDDPNLLHPVATEVEGLQVVGHLNFIDGWVEVARGEWEQV